jgi:DNA-directed RNA polymerase subunit F
MKKTWIQHATATCCRECISKWHKLQQGRELSQVQQDYLGYLSHYKKLPMEEVADEMRAILSDRNRIMKKKLESTNARWNEYLNRGIGDE